MSLKLQTGYIDPDQIAEFKECFNLYDRDNDGMISVDEMKLVMRSLEQCPSQRELKEISNELGKSKVTFPEFLDLMLAIMQKSGNPEIDIFQGFQLYDKNNTGVISMKDLRHILMRTGEAINQKEFEYMLREVGISPNANHVKYADIAKAFKQV